MLYCGRYAFLKSRNLQEVMSEKYLFNLLCILYFIIHQDRSVHTFSIVLPCGELVNKRQRYSPKVE